MSQTENPETRARRVKKNAPEKQPKPLCHIHDNVFDREANEIREKVCVNDEDFTEYEGKHYCLFHLPTKERDIEKFEEVLKNRLDDIEQEFAEIEELPEEEQEEAKQKIKYDFRYVWFPTDISFFGYKFSGNADFYSATFSDYADFDSATFSGYANFYSATFFVNAYFNSATFSGDAGFDSATFSDYAGFDSATFSGDAGFNSATFSGDADFDLATFSGDADFKKAKFGKVGSIFFNNAIFEKITIFDRARFRNKVSFNLAKFKNESDVFFRGAFFAGDAGFRECTAEGYLRFSNLHQGRESKFDFREAVFEKIILLSFHTVRLYPHSFVNVDSRKFVFTGIDWKHIDSDFWNTNITAELESLEKRGVRKKRKHLLEVACRQLAVNAEENNRYEEASKFRYMAMETRRLENEGWRRVVNLHWFYKWSSGYGESWRRGAIVLVGVLLFFALLYASPLSTFDYGEKKREIAADAVEQQIFDKADEGERFRDMNWNEGIVHSLYVAALQRPEPKSADNLTRFFIILETIFAPLQAALLALAIRRKFMR